jgi:hypothetical protein
MRATRRFLQGLQELGWTVAQNVQLEYRWGPRSRCNKSSRYEKGPRWCLEHRRGRKVLPLLVCAKTFSQHAGAVKVRAHRETAYRCMRSKERVKRRRQCEHRRQSSHQSVDILRLRNIGSSLSNQTSRSRLGVQAAIIPQRNHCKLLIGHLQDRAVRCYFMINAVASC